MFKLQAIQNQFFHCLINNQVPDFIKSPNQDHRFNVYRQTVFENLRNSLRITFPGVWKLIGNDCGNAVAQLFIQDIKNWPVTGFLDVWGEEFPEFLAKCHAMKDLIYIKDYANLEWLQHLSYHSAPSDCFNPQELHNILPDMLEKLKFSFRPSVFLLESSFPLDKIQALLENDNSHNIDLRSGPSYCIVNRLGGIVYTYWVHKHYWEFFVLLKNGKAISEACMEIDDDAEFNLSEILSFMFNKQLIQHMMSNYD